MQCNPKIKPCPACGNQGRLVGISNHVGNFDTIACYGCNMQGPDTDGEDAAINAWNNLPRQTQQRAPEGSLEVRMAVAAAPMSDSYTVFEVDLDGDMRFAIEQIEDRTSDMATHCAYVTAYLPPLDNAPEVIADIDDGED